VEIHKKEHWISPRYNQLGTHPLTLVWLDAIREGRTYPHNFPCLFSSYSDSLRFWHQGGWTEIFQPHQLNLLNVLTLWCVVQNNTDRELTTSYNYYQIPDVFLFPILFGSEPNVQMGKGDIFYSVKFMKESWESTEWAPPSFQNSPDATSLTCLLVSSLASLALYHVWYNAKWPFRLGK
jgi:hypothetical protein